MDLGVFQEMKVTKQIYNREARGYRVVANKALITDSGSISMFYRKGEQFALEALQLHIPNVVRFKLASGGQRWHVVG